MKSVGIIERNYNWERNICCHSHENWRFVRVWGASKIANSLCRRIWRKSIRLEQFNFEPVWPRVDLMHFWRAVNFGKTPWIVTTSTGLPFGKHWKSMRRTAEALASEQCRRILVTCDHAMKWQERKADFFPHLASSIMDKVELLPPPQSIVSKPSERRENNDLVCSLIGHDFRRKGGLEVLRAFEPFFLAGAPVRLNIVSRLADLGSEERRNVLEFVQKHNAISWYPQLPNEGVLELLQASDIALLPSFVETYGYGVLEAQACGCAVVTTDVFAFQETNSDEIGWLIRIDGSEYDYRSESSLSEASVTIVKRIEEVISSVLEMPAVVTQKATLAMDRITAQHCPIRHAHRLMTLYEEATP